MDIPNTYLFTAYYDDGEEYVQGEADQSLQNPEKNAFFDVFYQPIKPIESLHTFRLNQIDATGTMAVCLRTGAFEINGSGFWQHGHDQKLHDFKLMYYRVPAVHQTITHDKRTGESLVVDHHSLGYQLGWQAFDAEGRKVEKFIRV